MADSTAFDEPDEGVLELVLSSDTEIAGDDRTDEERRAERAERRQGLATRFLPGVDAGALFALALALVPLLASSLLETIATNHQMVQTFSQERLLANNPYTLITDATHIKAIGSGAFALVACAIAVLVLSRWREGTHARWSRPAAQAALCLGLIGLTFAVLLYTGAVGGVPAWHHPSPGFAQYSG